jgi:hypothetical protein
MALMAAFLAGLAGCYEQPVVESLALAFLPEGGVRVTVNRRITPPTAGNNPALEARIEETRRALAEGWDDWGRAFAAVRPLIEQGSWEKREGGLVRHERSAVLEGPEQLREFFGRTDLRVAYRTVGGKAEFTVIPAGSTRATRAQRERIERELEAWSGAVAAYLAQARPVFAYLGDHPERARTCFGQVFSECLTEEERAALSEPAPEEEPLLKAMMESMTAVLEVLKVPAGEAYTLNELSQLAFNPFPAGFIVEAPAPITEVEGFERTGERTARVPGLGLWEAYAGSRAKWLDPDPLQAYLEAILREDGTPFDLEAFCARPRRAAEPPGAQEVQATLVKALIPAGIYRIAWPGPNEESRIGSVPSLH